MALSHELRTPLNAIVSRSKPSGTPIPPPIGEETAGPP